MDETEREIWEQLNKWENEDLLQEPAEPDSSASTDDEPANGDDPELPARKPGSKGKSVDNGANGNGSTNGDDDKGKDKKSSGRDITFNKIIGGEFLASDFFRRQVKLLVLLVFLAIVYISNRYSYQQEMIEIDRLRKELTDIKYDALTRSSELTEKSRQSHIEEYVSQGTSALQTATTPPYLIKKEHDKR